MFTTHQRQTRANFFLQQKNNHTNAPRLLSTQSLSVHAATEWQFLVALQQKTTLKIATANYL